MTWLESVGQTSMLGNGSTVETVFLSSLVQAVIIVVFWMYQVLAIFTSDLLKFRFWSSSVQASVLVMDSKRSIWSSACIAILFRSVGRMFFYVDGCRAWAGAGVGACITCTSFCNIFVNCWECKRIISCITHIRSSAVAGFRFEFGFGLNKVAMTVRDCIHMVARLGDQVVIVNSTDSWFEMVSSNFLWIFG